MAKAHHNLFIGKTFIKLISILAAFIQIKNCICYLEPGNFQRLYSVNRVSPNIKALNEYKINLITPRTPQLRIGCIHKSGFTQENPEPYKPYERIEKEISSHPLVIFMKGTPSEPECGYSSAVIQILKACHTANFHFVNVLDGTSIRSDIKSYSSWPTIPQVYLNKEFIGGYDIVMEMFQDGSLFQMLRENNLTKT